MSIVETVLCDYLDIHDYQRVREQDLTNYVEHECTLCGHSTFDPR